jgi:threonine/homoserine/homoserine lactone efflux protein
MPVWHETDYRDNVKIIIIWVSSRSCYVKTQHLHEKIHSQLRIIIIIIIIILFFFLSLLFYSYH